jgi:hypothetical protein
MNGGAVERDNLAASPQAAPIRRQLEQRLHQFWKW